jgi:hypothetical protein
MNVARTTIALAVLGLAAAWFAATRSGGPAEAIGPAAVERVAAAPAQDSGELAPVDPTQSASIEEFHEAVPVADESAGTAVASRATSLANAVSGRLVVRAVDALSNEPLRSFGARLASETRFADEHSRDASGELELPLSPDTYSIVISAPGYESLELAPARVAADETNRLEPARLRPGSGRILVDVLGALSDGRRLQVELIGAGRRPCEHCGDAVDPVVANAERTAALLAWDRVAPCPACGFASKGSRVAVGASQHAEFGNLASGNYALRVSDGSGLTICEPSELTLREGAVAQIAFDLSSLRYVELEFLDTDGRSLSEEWRLRLADTSDEVEEIVVEGNGMRVTSIALEFRDEAANLMATASFVPPLPRGSVGFSIGVGGGRAAFRLARATFDRARGPDDKLWPEPAAARFGPATVACELGNDGLARVGPLPSSRLELLASIAHFAADATVPATRATTRVTLKLRVMPTLPGAAPAIASYGAFEQAGMR